MSDITIRNTKGFCEEFLKHYLAAGMGVQRLVNSTGSFERGLMPRLHRWKAKADEKRKLDRASK